jgi:L-threonylcarbamoyladenylate synthase
LTAGTGLTERLADDAAGIARAAAILRGGGLVAFGTETVYGLGADATNATAVARVYAAKGRPAFNPLICHCATADDAFAEVAPTDAALRLAAAFWPGPLTLVLPRRAGSAVALLTGAGLDSLAVRVPAHPTAFALLRAVGRPVAAPSANPSGSISPTTADHVIDGLDGAIDAVLDSGACRVGLESTVLDLTGPRPTLLRPGGVAREMLAELLGELDDAAASPAAPRSPGLLASHYAPALPLRLDATDVAADEALLAFGPPLPGAGATFRLSAAGDVIEAAANLFAGMRWLDAAGARLGLRGIAAMAVPQNGLGLAINDRLRRAAAPRA